MNEHQYSGVGHSRKLTEVWVVALYDPTNGDIVHAHSIAGSRDDQAISEKEAVEEAKAIARKVGHPVEKLTIKLSRNLAHALTPHRIDPVSGEFVVVKAWKHR